MIKICNSLVNVLTINTYLIAIRTILVKNYHYVVKKFISIKFDGPLGYGMHMHSSRVIKVQKTI